MLEELLSLWIFEELNRTDDITKLYGNISQTIKMSRRLTLQSHYVQFAYLHYLILNEFSYILDEEDTDEIAKAHLNVEENAEKIAKRIDENISNMLEIICTADFQIKYGYKPQELKTLLRYYNLITHEADLKALHTVMDIKDRNKTLTLNEDNPLYSDWESAKVYDAKKSARRVSNMLMKMRYCQSVLLYDTNSKYYAKEILLRYIETIIHTCIKEQGYINDFSRLVADEPRETRNKELSRLLPQECLDIFV